jgi:segregation and condensation protein B
MTKLDFEEDLSRASLETLAIVAYRSPITRAGIEAVRGVNSTFTLRTLLLRGLVERYENPADQRSYLYRPAFDLLKYLGIEKIENLPNFPELNKKLQDLEKTETQSETANTSESTKREEKSTPTLL